MTTHILRSYLLQLNNYMMIAAECSTLGTGGGARPGQRAMGGGGGRGELHHTLASVWPCLDAYRMSLLVVPGAICS